MSFLKSALIGKTGFVGGLLMRQFDFSAGFNTKNMSDAMGNEFDIVVCAAAPGSMMLANKYPDDDARMVRSLTNQLAEIKAKQFVLISSIAVLRNFDGQQNEKTNLFQQDNAYGRHRRELEAFCEANYQHCTIVRLPALFGPGLKKNFVFDILNPVPTMLRIDTFEELKNITSGEIRLTLLDIYKKSINTDFYTVDRRKLKGISIKNLFEKFLIDNGYSAREFTNPDSTFQYYDMAGLWKDIEKALYADLDVIHLATEPIVARDIYFALTGVSMAKNSARTHREDMRTLHAGLWGRENGYIAEKSEVMSSLMHFFNREKACI